MVERKDRGMENERECVCATAATTVLMIVLHLAIGMIRCGVFVLTGRNTCNALLDSFLTLPALEEVAFTVETVGEFPECIMPEDTLKALEKRGIYCRSMNFY